MLNLRSLAPGFRRFTSFASLLGLAATLPLHAAPRYTAIPLDGGGWFSGLTQAADGRLYGYGDVFGAWRSDNGGAKWEYLNWSIPENSIVGFGMAVQQDNSDVVYYLTPNDLFKSTDGGRTWTYLLQDLGIEGHGAPRFRGTSPVMIRADNPEEIWLAMPRKGLVGWLWRSRDGGRTWARAGDKRFDDNEARTLHNSPAFPEQIWVGAADGLYISGDGGETFNRIGATGYLEGVGMISRFATGPDAGVGLVTRSNGGGGIARVTATDYRDADTYNVKFARTDFHFGVPTGLQIFSDGSASAWNTAADRHGVSYNGGHSFELRPTKLDTRNVPVWTTAEEMKRKNTPDYGTDQVIEDVRNPKRRYITGGGAPMFSEDRGRTWSYFPNGSGIAAVKTYTARVSRHDPDIVYVPASDIGSAIVIDGGRSGTAAYSTNKHVLELHGAFNVLEGPDTRNLVLAGVHQGRSRNLILKSADGGATWAELDLADSGLPGSYEGITDSVMSFTDADDFLVVLGNSGEPRNPGMWRTRDGGKTFAAVTGLPSGLSTGHRYDPQPCFLERDAENPEVRYFTARDIDLYRSDDGGSTWTPTTHPYNKNIWLWSFFADPVRGGHLWASTDRDADGLSYSRDGGRTWTTTNQQLQGRHVSSHGDYVAFYGKAVNDTLPRIYYSKDAGETFTALTDDSHYFFGVQGLAVDARGRVWVSWNSITIIDPNQP